MYDDDDGARRIKDLWNEKQQREGIKIYKAHTQVTVGVCVCFYNDVVDVGDDKK